MGAVQERLATLRMVCFGCGGRAFSGDPDRADLRCTNCGHEKVLLINQWQHRLLFPDAPGLDSSEGG